MKFLFIIFLVFLFIGCNADDSFKSISRNPENTEIFLTNKILEEKSGIDDKKSVELEESVKKIVSENIEANIDISVFTEEMPIGFFATGTYIVPKDGVSVKLYAGARADDERYYGEFTSGKIAVIENIYEYCEGDRKSDYVWYQICILSTGMEGWIKVYKFEKNFKYSCVTSDFAKDNYDIHSINADIQVIKKNGTINHENTEWRDYDSVAVSPSGNEFIMNIDRKLYRYDIGSSSEKAVIESGDDIEIDKQTECAYAKNGKTIYIVTRDGNIYSYSIETEKLNKMFTFTFDEGDYYCPMKIYISPDERFIFTQSSVHWHSREDSLAFIYDRQLNKQYVFAIRTKKHPYDICGEFSNFIIDENNNAYASTFSFGIGESVLVHFYVDSDNELKCEQYEPGIGNVICFNPTEDGLIAFNDLRGIFVKTDKKGNITGKKFMSFATSKNSRPYFSSVNSDGTMAAFKYYTEDGYENIAIYSISSLDLLCLIKNEKKDGLNIDEFSGNTLIVDGIDKKQYTAYTLKVNEKERQFDFSTPYAEELEELCDDDYCSYEFFNHQIKNFEGEIEGGPIGVSSHMMVKFYPNGFYKITTEDWVEDSFTKGTIYGTYEMNWPNLKLFTATQRFDGDYNHKFNSEDFFTLPIVCNDYEDTKATVYMKFEKELKYNENGTPKITYN